MRRLVGAVSAIVVRVSAIVGVVSAIVVTVSAIVRNLIPTVSEAS